MLLMITLGLLNFFLTQTVTSTPSHESTSSEKYKVMNIDQRDSSDIYAIPYDDSEVEDEEEINRAEKKEVFPLPHSR